jgi:hypothetical protein
MSKPTQADFVPSRKSQIEQRKHRRPMEARTIRLQVNLVEPLNGAL